MKKVVEQQQEVVVDSLLGDLDKLAFAQSSNSVGLVGTFDRAKKANGSQMDSSSMAVDTLAEETVAAVVDILVVYGSRKDREQEHKTTKASSLQKQHG